MRLRWQQSTQSSNLTDSPWNSSKLAAKQNRLGPLTLEARRWMLEKVLSIQAEVNQAAAQLAMPTISLINDEEGDRILELIDAETFPNKWDGTEPHGDEWFEEIYQDGSIQPLLFK